MMTSTVPLAVSCKHLRDFFDGEKAAHHLDAHRMIAKAMAKSLQVLLRQDRRRRQHGHLFAAFDGEKRRAHGDFGFAVTDVAADQTVHGFFALHAGEGFVDGALLVGGFFILEGRFEFFVHVVRRREGGAGARFAQGVKLDQFFGHGENRFARLGFDFFPSRAAETVECRLGAVAADIFLHHVDAVHRQIQPVAAFVFQMQKLAFDAGDFEKFETAINADAVIQMHDEVVLLELAQAGQKMARMSFSPSPAGACACRRFHRK